MLEDFKGKEQTPWFQQIRARYRKSRGEDLADAKFPFPENREIVISPHPDVTSMGRVPFRRGSVVEVLPRSGGSFVGVTEERVETGDVHVLTGRFGKRVNVAPNTAVVLRGIMQETETTAGG